MLAIYYVEDSSPAHLYVLDVEDDNLDKFYAKVKEMDYPDPEHGEILFVENNVIVNQIVP